MLKRRPQNDDVIAFDFFWTSEQSGRTNLLRFAIANKANNEPECDSETVVCEIRIKIVRTETHSQFVCRLVQRRLAKLIAKMYSVRARYTPNFILNKFSR